MKKKMTAKNALRAARSRWGNRAAIGKNYRHDPFNEGVGESDRWCALYFGATYIYGIGPQYRILGVGPSWESAFTDADRNEVVEAAPKETP